MADVGAFPCYITQVDVKTALNHTLERFKPKAERQQMHVIINNKLPNTNPSIQGAPHTRNGKAVPRPSLTFKP